MQPVEPSVCLFPCLSVCLFVCLSVSPSICLVVYICIHLSVCLSVRVSVFPFIRPVLSVCSIWLPIRLFARPSYQLWSVLFFGPRPAVCQIQLNITEAFKHFFVAKCISIINIICLYTKVLLCNAIVARK